MSQTVFVVFAAPPMLTLNNIRGLLHPVQDDTLDPEHGRKMDSLKCYIDVSHSKQEALHTIKYKSTLSWKCSAFYA